MGAKGGGAIGKKEAVCSAEKGVNASTFGKKKNQGGKKKKKDTSLKRLDLHISHEGKKKKAKEKKKGTARCAVEKEGTGLWPTPGWVLKKEKLGKRKGSAFIFRSGEKEKMELAAERNGTEEGGRREGTSTCVHRRKKQKTGGLFFSKKKKWN